MVIKLYIDYGSQPARAVLAFCLINKIPHEVVQIKIFANDQRSPQYKKINPMKKVPAIVDTDNNFTLVESHSILKYLAQKFQVPEQWYPRKDIVKQAKINQFLDFHHMNTRRCSFLVFHTVFAPILKSGDPTFNSEWTYKVVKAALKNFEILYLKDQKYLGGDSPCIADLIAFFDITMLQVIDFDFSSYQKINRWASEMRKIKGVQQANVNFQKSKQSLKSLNPNAKL